jgi:hypothetical protein
MYEIILRRGSVVSEKLINTGLILTSETELSEFPAETSPVTISNVLTNFRQWFVTDILNKLEGNTMTVLKAKNEVPSL